MPAEETFPVTCPYCGEAVVVYLEADLEGEMVVDCEICCRPWRVVARRNREGERDVTVTALEE